MPEEFHTGSLLHVLTLGVVALVMAGSLHFGRRLDPLLFRRLVGFGCIAVWLLNTAYWFWLTPEGFGWERSLPLHFCNAANLFGALAVLRHRRLMQGVIYFWAALCIWAFLTPTVGFGPAHLGFWVFWIYHTLLGVALAHVLLIDRFRPDFRDLLRSSAFTLAYVGLLAALDAAFGWNYGFLGPVDPKVATPVDLLGPYPLRIVWMILIGALAFILLWLPFARKRPT